MKKQVFNSYLPEHAYVPDGEPHLFNGSVYIYGSHDKAFGTKYCEGNYVTWSAPEDDLSDWRYEGEIYKRTQDPSNADDSMQLWAPDVTQEPDGRVYLYYGFAPACEKEMLLPNPDRWKQCWLINRYQQRCLSVLP